MLRTGASKSARKSSTYSNSWTSTSYPAASSPGSDVLGGIVVAGSARQPIAFGGVGNLLKRRLVLEDPLDGDRLAELRRVVVVRIRRGRHGPDKQHGAHDGVHHRSAVTASLTPSHRAPPARCSKLGPDDPCVKVRTRELNSNVRADQPGPARAESPNLRRQSRSHSYSGLVSTVRGRISQVSLSVTWNRRPLTPTGSILTKWCFRPACQGKRGRCITSKTSSFRSISVARPLMMTLQASPASGS